MRRALPIFGPTAAVLALGLGLLLVAPNALMLMAPALALGWLVAVGLFTGEAAIGWVRRVARGRHTRRRTPAPAAPLRPRRSVPRGGLLLASALASRPPPAAA